MNNLKLSSSPVVRFALLTTTLLCTYFAAMLMVGVAEHTSLRVLNMLILYWGIHQAIAAFKKDKGKSGYLTSFAVGIKTGFLTTVMFSVAILLFNIIDAPFIDKIIISGSLEGAGSIFEVIGIISIEAIGSTVVCTYVSLQWLKTPRLQQQKKLEQLKKVV
jgi:hypothetical protein